MYGVQMIGLVEGNGGGHKVHEGIQSAVLSDSQKMGVARDTRITVQPSVDEVIVPNVLPGFIVIALGSAILERDYLADTLDKLEAGFLGILDLG